MKSLFILLSLASSLILNPAQAQFYPTWSYSQVQCQAMVSCADGTTRYCYVRGDGYGGRACRFMAIPGVGVKCEGYDEFYRWVYSYANCGFGF